MKKNHNKDMQYDIFGGVPRWNFNLFANVASIDVYIYNIVYPP